jgi:hypothetical protein
VTPAQIGASHRTASSVVSTLDDSVQVVAGYGDRPIESRHRNKPTKSALFDTSCAAVLEWFAAIRTGNLAVDRLPQGAALVILHARHSEPRR